MADTQNSDIQAAVGGAALCAVALPLALLSLPGATSLLGGSRTGSLGRLAAAVVVALGAVAALAVRRRRRNLGLGGDGGQAAWHAAGFAFASLAAFRAGAAFGMLGGASASAVAGAAVGVYLLERWWRLPLDRLPDPHPQQVWWAQVPFEDGAGSKDRPCLVLSGTGRSRRVLMFTSQDQSARRNYQPVPPHIWRTPKRSYLRTDRVISVRCESFRRLEVELDPRTYRELTGRRPAR